MSASTAKNSAKCLVILLSSAIVSAGAAGYVGMKAGRIWASNSELGFAAMHVSPEGARRWRQSTRTDKLIWSLSEALGLETFPSAFGQDKWIARFLFPGVEDGYFVDVGSGDGVVSSNSKLLEDRGWKGICIDPFPTNMEGRSCEMFEEVVFSVAGDKVSFRDAGFLGGIDSELGLTKEWADVKEAPLVEFSTVTLDDILQRANAPGFIHYMSLDIEGAELEALKGLSFS